METRSVSEWMVFVPHLRFGLPNPQALTFRVTKSTSPYVSGYQRQSALSRLAAFEIIAFTSAASACGSFHEVLLLNFS